VAAAGSSTACDAGRRVQIRLRSPYTLSTRPDIKKIHKLLVYELVKQNYAGQKLVHQHYRQSNTSYNNNKPLWPRYLKYLYITMMICPYWYYSVVLWKTKKD